MLTPEQMFYIASLKHTDKGCEHITWWGKNYCGYTPVVGDYIGEYKLDDARDLNNGGDHIAVPVEIVKGITSPEPYWKPGARFYDQRGSVVDNTHANWNKLLNSSLTDGRKEDPKPRVFRDKKRAIFTESSESLANQEKHAEIGKLKATVDVQREVITDLEDRLEKAHNTLQQFKQDWAIAWSHTPGYRKPPSKATLDAIGEAVCKIVNLDAVGNPLDCRALQSIPATKEQTHETRYAIMEAERNAAIEEYIKARPQLDTLHNLRIYEAGFKRGFETKSVPAQPSKEETK